MNIHLHPTVTFYCMILSGAGKQRLSTTATGLHHCDHYWNGHGEFLNKPLCIGGWILLEVEVSLQSFTRQHRGFWSGSFPSLSQGGTRQDQANLAVPLSPALWFSPVNGPRLSSAGESPISVTTFQLYLYNNRGQRISKEICATNLDIYITPVTNHLACCVRGN